MFLKANNVQSNVYLIFTNHEEVPGEILSSWLPCFHFTAMSFKALSFEQLYPKLKYLQNIVALYRHCRKVTKKHILLVMVALAIPPLHALIWTVSCPLNDLYSSLTASCFWLLAFLEFLLALQNLKLIILSRNYLDLDLTRSTLFLTVCPPSFFFHPGQRVWFYFPDL